MIRGGRDPSLSPTRKVLVSASWDHHQVVHDSKAGTCRCIGDGTEGGILRFRGVKPQVAAISDKDAAGCLAGRGPEDDGAGRKAGCLDPADGNDGVSDEAVAVVHVEDKCHVLPAVTEQRPGRVGGAPARPRRTAGTPGPLTARGRTRRGR